MVGIFLNRTKIYYMKNIFMFWAFEKLVGKKFVIQYNQFEFMTFYKK